MQTLLLNCTLVLLFVGIGGLFAASEMALVSLRAGQVRSLKETHGRRGRAVASLLEDENNFLSAVQVGVTLAGFFSASFGAAQISPYAVPPLEAVGLPHALAGTLAFVGVTIVVSYLSLVLGELVPKRLAMQSAESVALFLATPLSAIATVLRPVIWFLGVSTNAVLRLLGRDPQARADEMAPDELRTLVEENEQLGQLERRIASDILGISSRPLTQVMTPRTEVSFLEASLPLEEAARTVAQQSYSRYPISDHTHDHVIGYLHSRDLLAPPPGATTVRHLARPLALLPSTKPALEAMALLRERHEHMALVIDEYGGTAGVVTLEDIVEEFVGEITDEFDEAELAPVRVGDRVRLPGLHGRAEVRRTLGRELPEGAFDTLGGYLAAQLGRIPAVGDVVALGDVELVVVEMDGHRVDRVDAVHPARGASR